MDYGLILFFTLHLGHNGSMPNSLHLLSFDIPGPPNYGGVIDIYYKIKALHELGIKIFLHCFQYGRSRATSLEKFCENICYYRRNTSKILILNNLPYIVISRKSANLFQNLLNDNHPILVEGLHCCSLLTEDRFTNRKIIVRTHNIEHEYYAGLAQTEKNLLKRWYLLNQIPKLKRFESNLTHASALAAISPRDTEYFSKKYKNVHYLPPFHPFDKIEIPTGKGRFALYHGNLAVSENSAVALYLINQVFNDLEIPLIIAGANPSPSLRRALAPYRHIELKENPTMDEMNRLISTAQIHVLPALQSSGFKLKLLAALFRGRHCLSNSQMLDGTGLEDLCVTANNENKMKEEINRLFSKEMETSEKKRRETILMDKFSNHKNAEKLIKIIF